MSETRLSTNGAEIARAPITMRFTESECDRIEVAGPQRTLLPGPGLLTVVAERAESRPTAVAVQDGSEVLTYGELWSTASTLAADLADLGVADGFVGLCLPRGRELVTGALAIALAGAAYVAIDPAAPIERIRYMLSDSGVRAVVTSSTVASSLGALNAPALFVPEPREGVATRTVLRADPNKVAYAVYTSGSTGRPKGVAVDYAGLDNLVRWHRDAFDLSDQDRTTLLASPGFDASVWEIWPALASGATIVVVPEPLKIDPLGLRDWLVSERVTVAFAPTPLAESMLDFDWPRPSALRLLLTGGDRLTRRPPGGLPFALINNYGVSEAAVVSTSGRVECAGPADSTPPKIGAAISGVELRVVDEHLRPVPDGTAGELMIVGISVAVGYIGAAAADVEHRFVDDPVQPGTRAYRTGDLVRRSAEGEIEYLGRLDNQLQIHGVRVEPGEISAALAAYSGVQANVVLEHPDRPNALVAYIVGTDGSPLRDCDLRQHLEHRLPAQAIPAEFIRVPLIPASLNGKVDVRALHAFRAAGYTRSGREPATELERQIERMVAGVLGAQSVGVDDNFFLIGGHSMLGAQLIAQLRAAYEVDVPLLTVFDHPTVTGLAKEVERCVVEQISSLTDDQVAQAVVHVEVSPGQ